ncbi:hypothetical protein OX283_000410 [Flavobacterium sp. SUN052]|uniref:hypothetical protein n=1 Tax=Flavobacterium sp. SUN052 TaxID=3002441 RepID=UPI00237DE586|nr:hypothetical protein [Flavobacterium sp. SUN052]MEC4003104.1 hypothetical protein [Flavobacterium sp. SUN052]
MKNFFLLIIICVTFNCFAQYDSIKNITYKIDAVGRKLILPDKWNDFNEKNKDEHFISHCPIFINENNTILELAIWDSKILPLKDGNNLKKINKSFLIYLKEKNWEILLQEDNHNKGYYLYKIKIISRFGKPLIINHLIGVKEEFIYKFAVYNYTKETELDFEFLKKSFNNN